MNNDIIDANNFLNNEEISTESYSNINTLGLHIGDIHSYVDNKPDFKEDSQISTKVIPKYGFFLDANPTAIITFDTNLLTSNSTNFIVKISFNSFI